MKRLAIFFIIFMSICFQSYAIEPYRDDNIGVTFPSKLAGFNLVNNHMYEKDGCGGCGYSLRYQDESLFKADIYVYDSNFDDIGSGISSQRVSDEFKNILGVFPYLEGKGKYKNVEELEKGNKSYGTKRIEFLWAMFQYEQSPGEGVLYHGIRISNAYLTSKQGKFIKVRITFKKSELEKRQNEIGIFMNELSNLLGGF